MTPNYIVGHQTYWLIGKSADEAAYLAALLNAECFQQAYQDSRKIDAATRAILPRHSA